MKPLAWLILVGPFVLLIIGYYGLYYMKKHNRGADLCSITAFGVAIVTGVVAAYLAFFPIGYIVFTIWPNTPVNGHTAMPMGQYFGTIALMIVVGVVTAIIAFIRIRKWQKR